MVVSSSEAAAPPYPADTKAKGWRFELDYERIEQSDTWVLATAEMRPWLLMLWMTAWRQVPCGSLPAVDDLIAARIGMDVRQFRAHRDILMRGWSLHSDGRMYHGAITEQVLGLLGVRSKEAARKQAWRDKQDQQLAALRPAGQPQDSGRNPASATLPEPEPEPEERQRSSAVPPSAPRRRTTPSADAVKLMVADGVSDEVALAWMQVRRAKRLPLTDLAWRDVKEQAALVSMTPHQAVEYAARSSWGGFKASWVERDRAGGNGTKSGQTKSISGMNYSEGFDAHGNIL